MEMHLSYHILDFNAFVYIPAEYNWAAHVPILIFVKTHINSPVSTKLALQWCLPILGTHDIQGLRGMVVT